MSVRCEYCGQISCNCPHELISALRNEAENEKRMAGQWNLAYVKERDINLDLCCRISSLETELDRHKDSLDAIFKETGGHFCPEWDYLFIIPGSKEYDACLCEVGGPRRKQ